MRDNLADLPDAIRWAGRSGARFAIVTQLMPYQPDIVAQAGATGTGSCFQKPLVSCAG